MTPDYPSPKEMLFFRPGHPWWGLLTFRMNGEQLEDVTGVDWPQCCVILYDEGEPFGDRVVIGEVDIVPNDGYEERWNKWFMLCLRATEAEERLERQVGRLVSMMAALP